MEKHLRGSPRGEEGPLWNHLEALLTHRMRNGEKEHILIPTPCACASTRRPETPPQSMPSVGASTNAGRSGRRSTGPPRQTRRRRHRRNNYYPTDRDRQNPLVNLTTRPFVQHVFPKRRALGPNLRVVKRRVLFYGRVMFLIVFLEAQGIVGLQTGLES